MPDRPSDLKSTKRAPRRRSRAQRVSRQLLFLSLIVTLTVFASFFLVRIKPDEPDAWNAQRVLLAGMVSLAVGAFIFAVASIGATISWICEQVWGTVDAPDDSSPSAEVLYRCANCGLESPIKEYFAKVQYQVRPGLLCPACRKKAATALGWILFIAWLGLFAVGLLLLPRPGRGGVNFLLAMAFVLLFYRVLVVPFHELGHALAAKALGLPVFEVQLGSGWKLLNTRIAGTRLSIAPWGGGGFTLVGLCNLRLIRLKRILFVLAGPLVDATALAFMVWCWRTEWLIPPTLAVLLAITYGFSLFVNLVPETVASSHGQVSNDGLAVLQALTASSETTREWHAGYFALAASYALNDHQPDEALRICEQGLQVYPDNRMLQMMLGQACYANRDFARARLLIQAVLDQEDTPRELRSPLLNVIACTDILHDDDELLDEAERFAAEAVRLAPWDVAAKDTRGSVLVVLGRMAEGVPILEETIRELDTLLQAWPLCFLALAAARMGQPEKCREHLEQARKLDPHCLALEPIERRLARARLAL